MRLFTDGDGLPLAFLLFPGNQNEQKSLKPLESKILKRFGCEKFIYCSDAGLVSEDNWVFKHLGQRSFIVTQSIKKLPAEDREWALNRKGFKRLSDDAPVDITQLSEDDRPGLFYKDEPYTTKKLYQRLIITYSPKYAAYQKAVRGEQIAGAEKMVADGSLKKQRCITSLIWIRLPRRKNMTVSMPDARTCRMMTWRISWRSAKADGRLRTASGP